MSKKIVALVIAAALTLGVASGAWAIDFKIKGMWQYSFTEAQLNHVDKIGGKKADANDKFDARQRLRIQLDAIASESLSGSVQFELGMQPWGKNATGSSLGADGNNVVKLRQAYLDWILPRTDLKIRMGIQTMNLPKAAGGGVVMDNADTAAIVASYTFNPTVGLTAFWARPFNDNYEGYDSTGKLVGSPNYHDNMDLFGLTMPLRLKNALLTPWVMYGMRGANTFTYDSSGKNVKLWKDGMPQYTLSSNPFKGYNLAAKTDKAYGNLFWAGVPMVLSYFDPLRIELDVNYGYVEEMGRYNITSRKSQVERASTKREGWLAKALVEYALDWGFPGVFGWSGSGDDGNLKNGSERMPSVDPWAKFTSFAGGATLFPTGACDINSNYAGSWGVGAQLRDLSFVENLKHTLRVAYTRGTNSTTMVKYATSRDAWNYGVSSNPNKAGMYLTTADSIVEFTVDSYLKVYDNLTLGLELGYMVNGMDPDTWQKDSRTYLGPSMSKQDLWRASVYVGYSF